MCVKQERSERQRKVLGSKRANHFHVIQRPENDQLYKCLARWAQPGAQFTPLNLLLSRSKTSRRISANNVAVPRRIRQARKFNFRIRASKSSLPGIWLSEPHRTSIILPIERHNWPAVRTRFIVYTQLVRLARLTSRDIAVLLDTTRPSSLTSFSFILLPLSVFPRCSPYDFLFHALPSFCPPFIYLFSLCVCRFYFFYYAAIWSPVSLGNS